MPGKANGAGIDMDKGGEPFPEGEYHLRVVAAEAGKVAQGDNVGCDKVTVDFKVVEGEFAGRDIRYHTVSFLPADRKGAGMVLNFLKCIGEPYSKDGEYEWDERNWIGRVCKAVVTIEKDKKGHLWNKVKYVNEPDEQWKTANEKAAKAATEEIPF